MTETLVAQNSEEDSKWRSDNYFLITKMNMTLKSMWQFNQWNQINLKKFKSINRKTKSIAGEIILSKVLN